jgi:hypothetical protein
MRRWLAAAAATCVAAVSQAQPAPAAPDFSEGSARPSAAQLSQRLAGNVFVATWIVDDKLFLRRGTGQVLALEKK